MLGTLLSAAHVLPTPVRAADSLFARLVAATERGDHAGLAAVLAEEALSSAATIIAADGRSAGGAIRHGVPVEKIARRLAGCVVERWRDVDSDSGDAFVLWRCPNSRVQSDPCYFHVYRASMLDSRFHPANLLVHQMAQRDVARCGQIIVPPPQIESAR